MCRQAGWQTQLMSDRIALTKSELLPGSLANQGPETLGGYLVESVHNAISSSSALNAEQRTERNRHSDQLATVAADTIAMLPGFRASSAGLIRATALAKIGSNPSDFAASFARDFVEGAALNKVAANCMPEGLIGKKISGHLGTGLLAESASFALTGAGISGVSTAFRPETWLDKDKNFSVMHAGKEIALSSTIGGALSVPGGLIASRITKFGMHLGAEGKISQGSALAIAGLGSGYFSGSIIGGAQGLSSGGDFQSFIKGATEGGIAGALSGSIGLAGMHGLQELKLTGKQTNQKAETEIFAKNSIEKPPEENIAKQGRPSADQLWDSLEIKRSKLNDSEASLKDRVMQLGTPGLKQMQYYMAAENAEQVAAVSNSYEEFRVNGGMRLVSDNVRVYNVAGNSISIPESYAMKLDEVLQLRLKAAQDPDLYVKGPAHAREVGQAQLDLAAHPLRDRAHPADFVQLLAELSDRSLVKDLFIREDRAPSDAWHSKIYEKGFRAAATAGQEDGRITMHAQNRSPLLREYMKHEFGHLVKWNWSGESARFDQAAALEKDGYFVSKYSRKNTDENWAEHFASLTDPDPDKFLGTAHGAPLRTVEMATALMKTIGNAQVRWQGTHQAELARRVDYVQKYIIPEAQMKLTEIINSGNAEQAVPAIKLLGRIGSREDFELLAEQARVQENADVRKAAFQAAWGKLSDSNSYGAGSERRTGQMRDFLLAQAEPGGKSRITAIELLSRMRDDKSRFYYDLLSIGEKPGSKLSQAINLMDRAPDKKGLQLAWEQALKATGASPDGQVNLALRALDRYSALIEESVGILAKQAQPRTVHFLRDLTGHYNARIAESAAEAVRQIEFTTQLESFNAALSKSSTAEQRVDAANALAATKNPRAAGPLLDAFAAATSETERLGISRALKRNITPEIWKFELRFRKQTSPETAALFKGLMG